MQKMCKWGIIETFHNEKMFKWGIIETFYNVGDV